MVMGNCGEHLSFVLNSAVPAREYREGGQHYNKIGFFQKLRCSIMVNS